MQSFAGVGVGVGVGAAVYAAIAFLFAIEALAAAASENAPPDGVVIVHSNQRPVPATAIIDDTLRRVVAQDLGRPVEFFSEFLDSERFFTSEYAEAAAALLRRKYIDRNIKVFVAIVPQALQFVRDHREQILPGVPVVYVSLPMDALPREGLPPDFVGTTIDLDPTATFSLALRLQPNAKRLIIVVGAQERDRVWERRIRNATARLSDRLEVEYLSGQSTAQVLARLSSLTPDTIVYTPGYFSDGTGQVIAPRQAVEQMAAVSKAPVYGPYDTFLGFGIVGGAMSPYADQAKTAAATVARLLNGTSPSDIAPSLMPNVPTVDWRQLRRWGFDEKSLPPDTVVMFREPTVWDRYWREISVSIAILFVQAGLIAGLLTERRLRRRTATALEESEKQMNLAARAARLSLWFWDVARDKVWTTAQLRQQMDPAMPRAVPFSDVLKAAHPADREALGRAVNRAVASGEELDVEYRLVDAHGAVRWMAVRGRVDEDDPQRLLGVALDVTERKHFELRAARDRIALRHLMRVSMLGQLSAAIAHQLNQPLAAILGNAEAAQRMLGRERVDLVELREICNDIVSEDHRAAEIIRRLRDLYSRGDMTMERLDLNGLIHETLGLLRTELVTRQVTPATDLAPDLPEIQGARVQLQQVLLNLLLNAADAMSDAEAADRIVTIRSERGSNDVKIYVTDRGTGIAAADLKHVFDAFWTTKERGMGVGLAICQSIVTAHGGNITAVNNNPLHGTTFSFNVPLRQPA